MDCTAYRIPYRETRCFTKIVLDYIDQAEQLKPFFAFPPTHLGIKKAIEARRQYATDRGLLVQELKKLYSNLPADHIVSKNIDSLLSNATFTICTAHQPNIFTGPLFFIYKILHVIKLSEYLNTSFPEQHFVPVYYMGSEDADLDELGHIYLNGEKLIWQTSQTGAVGRMKIDTEFLKLIPAIEGQISILPFGNEVLNLLKECYKEGVQIQTATFRFVNALLGKYGLIIFIPDNAALKKKMIPVFKEDILNQVPSTIVEKTSEKLSKLYKIQANPREINLFYLRDNIRERIVYEHEKFHIQHKTPSFTRDELLDELEKFPDHFSPNVILRGLYQETILPNIMFVGGGGELAYWLQLKDLFTHYKVPFPILLLRNSFLVVEKKWQEKIAKLQLTLEEMFLPEQELMNRIISRESKNATKLNGTFSETEQLYEQIKKQAAAVDLTLGQHVEALRTATLRRLHELEKKMLRAEKRKFIAEQHQIQLIKNKLFPNKSLQERYDNMLFYYSKWGEDFISQIFQYSLNLEQEFTVLQETI
jgi:bacillithiol synthase